MDTNHIKTWRERVAHLDHPTDFAERCAAIEEAGELRAALFSAMKAAALATSDASLTDEQRGAIEWAAGRAHVESLGKPITGDEFRRWVVLKDLFSAGVAPAAAELSPEKIDAEIDAAFRRNLDLRVRNLTVGSDNKITWIVMVCRGIESSLSAAPKDKA
jgi:hypothetical protein